MMKRRFRKGQSILEYTLLFGAVIAVIIAVLLSKGGMKDKFEGSYNKVGNALENTTSDLTGGVFQ